MIKFLKLKAKSIVKKHRRLKIGSYNRKGDFLKAENYIRKNSLENEYDFNSDFELSSNLLNQGRYNEAEHLLKRMRGLHEISPDNVRFRWVNGQAKLRLAQLEYKKLRVSKAIAHLKTIELYSGFNDFYIANELLARLYNYQGRDEDAFDIYNKILKTNYKKIENISERYFSLASRVLPDLSPEDVLKKEHDLEPEYYSSVALAKYYLSVADYDSAFKFVRKIPSDNLIYFSFMGEIYLQKGEYREAISNFFRAWLLRPFKLGAAADCYWCIASYSDSDFVAISSNILMKLPFIKRKPTVYRKLAMLSRDVSSVLNSYQGTAATKGLSTHFPKKYVSEFVVQDLASKSVLVLPLWGIGDEIIIASVYRDLHAVSASSNIKLTVGTEPRLFDLMRSSFPEIKFIPIDRKHRGPHLNAVSEQAASNNELLPNQDLYYTLDYQTWLDIEKYDFIVPAPIVARDLRASIQSFDLSEGRYLVPNAAVAEKFKRQLESISSKPKVGISWRSGYGSKQRSLYYTKVSQWGAIFALSEHVDFVSLQYDNCDDELEFVKSQFGVEVITFDGVDLYNDLDSVCALISVMDLTIAPCTVMSEFSGAIGVETLHLAASREGTWRLDEKMGDVWFDSMKLIVPDKYGDNASMLEKAANEIKRKFLIDVV